MNSDLIQEDIGLAVIRQLAKIRPWPYYSRAPVSLDHVLEKRATWYENTQWTLQKVRYLIINQPDPVLDLAISGNIIAEPPPRLRPCLHELDTAINGLGKLREMLYLSSTMGYDDNVKNGPSRYDGGPRVFDDFYSKVKLFVLSIAYYYHGHHNYEALYAAGISAGLIDG